VRSLRFRPSQLPPPQQGDPRTLGLFVTRHAGAQRLVKAPYLSTEAFDAICAALPRRPAPPAAEGDLLGELLNAGAGGERSAEGSGHSEAVQRVRAAPPAAATGPTQSLANDEAALNAAPSPEEIRRLGHAIRLYAVDRRKQHAIETAFRCTKGGGLTWRRASRLFDLAVSGGRASDDAPPASDRTDDSDDDVPPAFRRLNPEEE
jgi:hypothetical protein